MPTWLFGLLLFKTPSVLSMDSIPGTARLSLLVLIFIGTFAVPSLLIYYLFRSGYVRSLQLTTLEDRRLPYFLTAFVYTILAYLFRFQMQGVSTLAPEIGILIASIAVSILLVGFISLSWQISAHSVGLSGVVGVIGGFILRYSLTDLFGTLVLLIMVTGLVASARLKLNAHTLNQVGAGFVLGLSVSLITVYWLI
ncbi:hypothetical protein IC229_12600 [Spirosoma sp. BT702]|uniref:Phosphatase PAP2 family protein n=1 Tax=Spirosoma profusum TaxID=2771354 RepID=A0A926XVP0_9BACT|nr:hypothetical protein [Spirosoma profusum]MBD2701483.1 hypothetical protein [Spirosoma profusum]